MPEGPEVETVRRTLLPLLLKKRLGQVSVSRKALRTRVSPKRFAIVEGRTVVDVTRHGKALFVMLNDGVGLCVRLGMTGRVVVVPATAARDAHTHVRIAILDDVDNGPAQELRYVDARRFGEVVPFEDEKARAAVIAEMGPDGLRLNGPDRVAVAAGLLATKRCLKDALLDQKLVAGVGNIYAAEILWTARLSPFRAASTLGSAEIDRLLDATQQVLVDAAARRGTSFSDYVDATGARGDNLAHLAVFQREGEACPSCQMAIKRVVQGQRSTFFCSRCQAAHQKRRLG